MSVLLIAEHNNTKLKPFTLNAITAASKMDADVHVLIAGTNCENVSKEIISLPMNPFLTYTEQNYTVEELKKWL